MKKTVLALGLILLSRGVLAQTIGGWDVPGGFISAAVSMKGATDDATINWIRINLASNDDFRIATFRFDPPTHPAATRLLKQSERGPYPIRRDIQGRIGVNVERYTIRLSEPIHVRRDDLIGASHVQMGNTHVAFGGPGGSWGPVDITGDISLNPRPLVWPYTLLLQGTSGPPTEDAMVISGPTNTTVGAAVSVEVSPTGSCGGAIIWDAENGEVIAASGRTATIRFTRAGSHLVTAIGSEPVYPACAGLAHITADIAPGPNVIVASLPGGLAQETNLAGASETFTLANLGTDLTVVTLTRSGAFTGFVVDPSTAAIAAGASASFTIAGTAQPAGFYEGRIDVTGAGVPAGMSLPVRLISANRPSTPPRPRPLSNRVDIGGRDYEPQDGTVTFTNDGTGTVRGVFSSDVPWIVHPAAVVEIAGNSSASFAFWIDLAKRPPDTAATGTLSLQYLLSPLGKTAWPVEAHTSTGVSTTLVTIVSTKTKPPVSATLSPLAPGEIALFAPGIGRVRGIAGLYISDLALSSLSPVNDVRDVRMYFTPIGQATRSVTLDGVSRTLASPIGDLVSSAFKADQQLGGLQIRSRDIAALGVSANISIADNELGSFGTAIPIFRSDRGTESGGRLILTGLEKNGSVYANFYVQETAGRTARVRASYFGSSGAALGSSTVDLEPFGLSFIGDPLPPGAVAAILEHEGLSSGAFTAYAAGLDRRSEDFWAIPDWGSYFGWDGVEPLIFPIAGSVPGANNTHFRTDVSLTNSGAAPAIATLVFRGTDTATGAAVISEKQASLAAGESKQFADVTRSLFTIDANTIGHIVIAPGSSAVRATARTYNLVPSTGATFGTSVPSIPLSATLRAGGLRRIGAIEDSSLQTLVEARPATFRSNLGLVETSGKPATVRVTMRYRVPSDAITQLGAAAKQYELPANGFRLVSRIANDILGDFRGAIGDLHNIQLDFEVVAGEGAVIPFVTTVDNGTGDSSLRIE